MEVREKKRERSSPSFDGGRRRCSTEEEEAAIVEVGNSRPSNEKDGNSKPSSPQCKSVSSNMQDNNNHLESARAEMGEVREENQRLKMYLDRIMKDYKTLQTQFDNIVKHDQINKNSNISSDHSTSLSNYNVKQEKTIIADESDLVCLSLGRVSSTHSPKDDHHNNKSITSCVDGKLKLGSGGEKVMDKEENLALSLDCKFGPSKSSGNTESTPLPLNRASPTNSLEQDHKEDAGETWPPSKMLKTMKSTSGEDEVSQQNPVKKARVSVRARCDTPTMNDGCQWRKYGQKIAKGNPCPRAYYRCTVAPSCPVRKQVQRCADDMSILTTTYEGTHNHPLPMSATAMASTTSAAASMLLSGSSSSQSGSGSSVMANNTSSLHGLNYYLSDASKTKQFYIPNSSSISPSASHPTITLDLTSNSFSYPTSSSFSRFSSTYPSTTYAMNNPACLSFNCSDASMTLPISWSNNGVLSYGNGQGLYNKNQGVPTLLDIGRQVSQEGFYQSYLHKNKNPNATSSQEALPDTITAATKAITADPNFQTVLAAALKSIISNNGNNVGALGSQGGGGGNGDNLGQKLRWSNESFPVANTQQVNGCASSYLNKSSATNSQPGSLTFLPPALPFSSPKNAAASPCKNRDLSRS